jgi:hypothetical protein
MPCVDSEEYARIYNTGYADAQRHLTAPEPWEIDLSPFEQVLAELDQRKRTTGGGVQTAYATASALLRAALRRYDDPDEPTRH